LRARPWDERRAFLIGLTGAAGTLDALAFLHLGKVFNSFQSGNVLFLGIGAGSGEWGLVVRAGAVLAAFVAGTAVGARLIGDRLSPDAPSRAGFRVLGVEAALLAAFAVLWLAIGAPAEHPAVRVVLLALGAGAMGVQVAFALALKVPNVVTVALTATLAALGQHAGDTREARNPDLPSNGLLLGLCAAYAVCATVIAVLPESSVLSLAPLLLLAAAVAVDRLSGASPSSSPSRGASPGARATSSPTGADHYA
jgi:uncharacterized membrane protein YoaK (UPF0700 family)